MQSAEMQNWLTRKAKRRKRNHEEVKSKDRTQIDREKKNKKEGQWRKSNNERNLPR